MTKTQPNRTTIFIMNLWVSRIRQLTILAVALFFYSCVDETNLIGFKPPNSKFDVKYIELPVESSVISFDNLRTSNYLFPGETNRLLVGKYSDDKFGDVESIACSQFFTFSLTKLAATATFDYATLDLAFDFYTYGASKTATDQSFSIYELDQQLATESRRYYFNKTPIITKATEIGTKTFTLDPAVLKTYLEKKKDTVVSVNLDLDLGDFGQRIFNSAIQYRDAITKADSTFVNYSEFIKLFNGIAIVPNQCDKAFGFSPSNPKSRIKLHYHLTTDTIKRTLDLSFISGANLEKNKFTGVDLVGYNNISSNKSGKPIDGINDDYQDFFPTDEKRYIQSGLSIFTKLDMSKFLDFSDTIPNMIFNSAELVIGNVEDGGSYDPPQYLALRVLKENNRQYAYGTKNAQSNSDALLYKGFIRPDYNTSNTSVLIEKDSVFSVSTDDGRLLEYNKSSQKYNAYLTRFLQQVYNKEEGKTPLRYFVLYPVSPSAAKSVNRVVFPQDKIKLRLYYTLPTVTD